MLVRGWEGRGVAVMLRDLGWLPGTKRMRFRDVEPPKQSYVAWHC